MLSDRMSLRHGLLPKSGPGYWQASTCSMSCAADKTNARKEYSEHRNSGSLETLKLGLPQLKVTAPKHDKRSSIV
jgi:hypothetical protein